MVESYTLTHLLVKVMLITCITYWLNVLSPNNFLCCMYLKLQIFVCWCCYCCCCRHRRCHRRCCCCHHHHRHRCHCCCCCCSFSGRIVLNIWKFIVRLSLILMSLPMPFPITLNPLTDFPSFFKFWLCIYISHLSKRSQCNYQMLQTFAGNGFRWYLFIHD